ncbi:hypothetical protein B0H10DRAFT_2211860 [Mycena sp. CBHHK59/15]|nr:hypothetical protein B0H10DRAFT_2211860 [Mycena sp. CBHHK59/15]
MAPKKAAAPRASITDFFPRMSTSQSSSQTLIDLISLPPPNRQRLPPRRDQEVISVSSASHITVSSGTRSIITVSSDASIRPRPRASCDPMESISARGPGRAPAYHVAPAANLKSPPPKQSEKHSALPKTSFKRKTKPDSDSEMEQIDAVVYVPRSPAHTRVSTPVAPKPTPLSGKENLTHQLPQASPIRKKPRILSPEPVLPVPEPIAPSDPGELVPSSQSDEQEEMVLRRPIRDPVAVMQDVDRWRNEAASPASLPMSEPEDMDVSRDSPRVPLIVPSEDMAIGDDATVFTPESSPEPQTQRLLTPQLQRARRSIPVTPVALTEASKTAKIIADIKAKANALALSSPEQSPLTELRELEDSSDEEELFVPRIEPMQDPFSSASSSATGGRYSLRDRGVSSAASTFRKSPSPCSRRSRAPPPRGPVILTKTRPAPKKAVSMDPLGALLKEKARADKGGKGSVAFRLAEDAMHDDGMLQEGDEGDIFDWTNEVAARKAIQAHGRSWLDSCPGPSTSDSDEVSLNDEDRCRLLGEKRGKAVVGILDSDRIKKEAAKGRQKVQGVPLWEDDSALMDADYPVPSLQDAHGHPVLTLLKSRIDSGDHTQAALLLGSGIFANLDLLDYPDVIPYFCDLALSTRNTPLTTPAFHALSHIWKSPSVLATGMRFRAVHAALVRLGATNAVMDAMGWAALPDVLREPIHAQEREDVLYRLVRLLTMSTQSGQQPTSAVPDFLMASLLVGIDPSCSPDLQREFMVAVDLLCQSLAPSIGIIADQETAICNRLIQFCASLEPINKAHVMSFLAGGSGRTARIARWVAHSIIADIATLSVEKYTELPPLVSLLDPLAPHLSSKLAGADPKTRTREIFELYDNTDYVNMKFYVQILAVAISNVKRYVQQEQGPGLPDSPTHGTPKSPGKPSAEKTDTILTLVRSSVESLHGRIVDTRAAHLDRSRTKAALKELSMRIFYQQKAALRSQQGKKSKNLQQYFVKPK